MVLALEVPINLKLMLVPNLVRVSSRASSSKTLLIQTSMMAWVSWTLKEIYLRTTVHHSSAQ